MVGWVKNRIEIKTKFSRKLRKLIFGSRLQFSALILLSFVLSGYQGKLINFTESNHEEYHEVFQAQIGQFLSNGVSIEFSKDEFEMFPGVIEAFYKKNEYQPYWTLNYQLNNKAETYIKLLSTAYYYGLDSNEYYIAYIREINDDLHRENNYAKLAQIRVKAEVLLTYSSVRFLNALENGVLAERATNYNLDSLQIDKLSTYIIEGSVSNDFQNHLLSCQPDVLPYTRLQKGLEKFLKSIEVNHSIKEIPNVKDNPEKAKKTAINILASLYPSVEINNDKEYVIALKMFQRLHGLNQSGTLDKKTCKALSMGSKERYQKIAMNLERLRQEKWSSNSYILVNIPAFKLRILEDNKEVASFKTIIGKPVSPTPVFSDKIEKIVTHPSWIVPQSISSKELLYKAKTDSTFLKRNNYVVFDELNNEVDPGEVNWEGLNSSNFNYKLIQRSSAGNALGKIKFLFPNEYSVYVHDTPSKSLFSKDYRAYSHGCVRLENPHYLAEYLIKKQNIPGWENKLKNNLNRGIQGIFELPTQIEIHIRYYTCEADDDGQIYFYNDIYNKDNELMSKLYNEPKENQQLLAKK